MYTIIEKKQLTKHVTQMSIRAPLITLHAKPGQFVMVRATHDGERIPLTIVESNQNDGLITIIFQVVGASTFALSQLLQGEYIHDIAGPLGKPSDLDDIRKVILIGGGLGSAILYPILKTLHDKDVEIITILGFKSHEYTFLTEDFTRLSNQYILMTDDGSVGKKGFVTDALKEILSREKDIDRVIAIGPLPMMKAVALMTKPYQIKTIVSMNPIMIDGTGMCGGCRIHVGNDIKFACVDGPEFDAHLINFDEAMSRNRSYIDDEKRAYQSCKAGDTHE